MTDRRIGRAAADGPPRRARVLVSVTLVLIVVAGLTGVEAWPLTSWRLFSLSRDADQTRWLVQAVDRDGDPRIVSLEELPLRYRNAEWPMAELPAASPERRRSVCTAIADAVAAVHPATAEVQVVRDRQRLEETADGWEIRHDPEVVHACEPTT